MAAFKINQDFIAANLCINRFEVIPVCKGSCYLENQLNQDQKQQQKFPDLKTKEINLFCQHNTIELPTQVIIFNNNTSYPKFNISFISSAHLRSVFRPPSLV
ncbi:MAG: hypothetical protein IPJ81_16805 [Chitinophagaceae bacterium]|nr:hypothetical protein [Chitinophagaceae bacterium]